MSTGGTERSNVRQQIAHYERLATRFDRSVWSLGCRDNRNHLVKISAIARATGARDAGRILEVGTGTGLHARWILENTGAAYTGVDVSEPMLAIARERLAPHAARISLGIADAHRLPHADASFDAAFCSGTLHHLSDPARGLRELARVTRPGGRVAAMEPNWKFPSVLIVTALNRAERNAFKINGRRLVEWARAAGLADVTLERLLYTPPAPRSWARFWDRADRALGRAPALRRLSIMQLVSGTRA